MNSHLNTGRPGKISTEEIEQLKAQLTGALFLPGEADYEKERLAWNRTVQQHPALIVVAENVQDVSVSVRFAGEHDLGIAVQSTGHGIMRPADENSLLIITSRLAEVTIDVDRQTAWIGAGLRWGTVLEKTQAAGLAPLLGSSPGVGVVGYTLGGGIGWLAGKYGLAVDSVRTFELVTADGNQVHASRDENRDLFWGLGGGGGSFGVITRMEIQLYPITTIYGGSLIYPIEQAREVFARYRAWIAAAPDELTTSISIMNMPNFPSVPEFLRGKSVVFVRGAYAGPVAKGEELVKPWLDWTQPIVNSFKAMPFSDVAQISNDPKDPAPSYGTGSWLRELNDEAIDILIQHMAASQLVKAEIRHVGGAVAQVEAGRNAYSHRRESLLLQALGITPTSAAHQAVSQAASVLMQALQPHLSGRVYLNFLEGPDAQVRVQDGFSAQNYRRLAELKQKYDPHNRFSHGYKIQPMVEPTAAG